jgi:hypothetical protein
MAQSKNQSKTGLEELLPPSWPKRWEEISRSSGDNSISVMLGHKDPTQAIIGLYNSLKQGIQAGLIPMSMAQLENMMTQWKAGNMDKYDFQGDITITKYQDEKTAKQAFENQKDIPTQGFDVPIPGGPPGMSMSDIVHKKEIKAMMTPQQIEEMKAAFKEVREAVSKVDVKYKKGRFIGQEAIIAEKEGKRVCVAVLIDKYVVTGIVLNLALSVGQEEKKSKVPRRKFEPGMKGGSGGSDPKRDKDFNPEDYLNKKEVEGILKSTFERIERQG